MKCPTPWLGKKRGYLTDWITQRWVCLTGQKIDPAANEWLMGPIGNTTRIGADFFERIAADLDCEILVNPPNAGLIKSFKELRADISPASIEAKVVKFYESTSDFEMDVWSEWCSAFRPFGWLLRVLFSHRLEQLHMPISSLETSCGITSDIIQVRDRRTHDIRLVGWLRTMVESGNVIYVGFYSICYPPGEHNPCLKVVFPLPNGNATVIMTTEACTDGSLKLHSKGNSFGGAGFYFLVQDEKGQTWAKYVSSMRESIHVHVDKKGELRADHVLKYFGLVFLRLHYRIFPRSAKTDRINSSLPATARS